MYMTFPLVKSYLNHLFIECRIFYFRVDITFIYLINQLVNYKQRFRVTRTN